MAIALTVTVGTTDYSFDWVAQTIWIESGVQGVTGADLKQAIGDAQDSVIGMAFPQICVNFNPVVLTATTSTFLNVVLEDQWRINSFSPNGFLVMGTANIVNVNNGIDIFEINAQVSFINNTSAAGVLVTGNGSGLDVEQAAQLLELWQSQRLDPLNPKTTHEDGTMTFAGKTITPVTTGTTPNRQTVQTRTG